MQSHIYRLVVSLDLSFSLYVAKPVLISGAFQTAPLALVLALAPSHTHLDLVLVPVSLGASS